MAMNELFYRVHRIFFKGAGEEEVHQHSVEYYNDFGEALKRYFNIVAGDYANTEVTYFQTFIMDKFGRIPDGRIETLDRRDFTPPEPEPEPQPEPEPEPAPETEPENDAEQDENG